jgi:hypothetical protein
VPHDLGEVVWTFERRLYLPDASPLLAILGTIAANLLPGDPVWLLIVAPPGSGKSELLQATGRLEHVHPVATLTEAALLSGTAKRDRAAQAKGGLLKQIGEFGIILAKDFGSVLNMNRDARAAVLAALREVYDGSWTRHVGTDGGQTLSWSGKVGLIAGCTPTIDRHHAVMGAMGERFVLFRPIEVDGSEQARRALAHAGHEREMRDELAAAVAGLFEDDLPEPRQLTEEERERLVALSSLVVRCRSAVERDSYSREVELVPGSEAPTRLIVVLDRLLAGLDVIGVERELAWSVVAKAALDSMPALRRAVLDQLYASGEPLSTPKVAEAVRHPTQTTRRALEDLTAHGIAVRVSRGDGGRAADTWALTDLARGLYRTCVPETSEGTGSLFITPTRVYDDISGTHAGAAA